MQHHVALRGIICCAPKEVSFFGFLFQINDVYMDRISESWQLHAETVLELLRTWNRFLVPPRATSY